MDSEFFLFCNFIGSQVIFPSANLWLFFYIAALLFLLAGIILLSTTEIAFVTINPAELKKISLVNHKHNKYFLQIITKPEQTAITLHTAIYIHYAGFLYLSVLLANKLAGYFQFSKTFFIGFLGIPVLILFIAGYAIPRTKISPNPAKIIVSMLWPVYILSVIFKPFTNIYLKNFALVKNKLKENKFSIKEENDIQADNKNKISGDSKILNGIVSFRDKEVSHIMTPRVDMMAVNIHTPFKQLLKIINENHFSRIPVYNETIDDIKGILYAKDLIPYLNENVDFGWKRLIREPYFIPENKKLNTLLDEFQTKKIHMGIVSDEYGRINGIVTMEDIIEEIVGEINDENDEQEINFKKIDDYTFVFEGKTLLNDFFKELSIPSDFFNDIRGEAETLAGLILELHGDFPKKDDTIKHKNYQFKIESIDNRRIKKIKVTIPKIN